MYSSLKKHICGDPVLIEPLPNGKGFLYIFSSLTHTICILKMVERVHNDDKYCLYSLKKEDNSKRV